VRPAAVLISGSRIVECGELADAAITPRTRRIDIDALTILPGLIDAHAHLTLVPAIKGGSSADVADAAAAKARDAVRAGVTTVRDVGGYRHADLELRDAIAAGDVDGPAMQCAGQIIIRAGAPGEEIGVGVKAASQLRAVTHAEIDAAADLVKVIGSGGVLGGADDIFFSERELRDVVAEASGADVPVAVHAHPAAAVKNAVRAGAASVEHGSFLDDEAVAAMLDSDAFLVPTFAIYELLARSSSDSAVARTAASILSRKSASFRLALERGVRWGVGSDADASARPALLVDEAAFLVRELGLTPREVVTAMTRGNAQLLGIGGEVGSIEPGRRADLTIVEGNPLRDIEALRRVALTVTRGVVHDWRPAPD
jgi:imidazolonepropionase-like amidohydrolase